MKGFKEFERRKTSDEYRYVDILIEGCCLHVLTERGSQEETLLLEAQHKGQPLGGKYSAQFHRAHTPQGLDHLHVYAKNNQLFAINADSSAHDQSHGVRIPNKVAKAIRRMFPDIVLPTDNLIESVEPDIEQIAFVKTLLD